MEMNSFSRFVYNNELENVTTKTNHELYIFFHVHLTDKRKISVDIRISHQQKKYILNYIISNFAGQAEKHFFLKIVTKLCFSK